MHLRLIRNAEPPQGRLRPAKVIALEARRQARLEALRREREAERDRPRPAA